MIKTRLPRTTPLPLCLAALCVAALAGCAVGPDFTPPKADVPEAFSGPLPPAAGTADEAARRDIAQWWTSFNDPILTSLIDRAMVSNLDVKQAAAKLREARAARGVVAGQLGPEIDGNAAFTRSRMPGIVDSPSSGSIANQYQLGLDATWEIDIFGGQRRNLEAADADVLAAVENQRGVFVSLAAEVAVDYVGLRTMQQRIAIARRNLQAQKGTADLTRQRFKSGFAGSLDVTNADALAASTTANIPSLETAARQYIHSLSVLLGQPPAALAVELTPAADIPSASPAVPVGVPSDLVRRRPDIRTAEARIHAATARVGVATADLFPKFMLNGAAGYQSATSNTLLSWNNRFWSFGPSASWNLFDTGRTRAGIEVQKALEEQALLTYRQTVLSALMDAENALVASVNEEQRRAALRDAAAAYRKSVDAATLLYSQGQTDFLNVLDAERSLYATEESLAISTQTVSTNLIALYKAIGGGWEEKQP